MSAAIDDGTIERLGVTALWLSPVYTGPERPREGREGCTSTSYHGYWPLDSRGVEPRLGGDAALRELIARAHAAWPQESPRLVPNHLTRPARRRPVRDRRPAEPPRSALYLRRRRLLVGRVPSNLLVHLDLHFQDPAMLMDQAVDDDLVDRHRASTPRIDAVPMMPRATTRIAAGIRERLARERRFLRRRGLHRPRGLGIDVIRYASAPTPSTRSSTSR
ncbi:MAG: alpha-amylase family glycosyl hydrolase [Nannocystaceae bacterium]